MAPNPPPTVAIEPSGSSTVLACERATLSAPAATAVFSCQPGVRSSKVVAESVASGSTPALLAAGLSEPPSCITSCEPSGPAGTRTAVPQTRLNVVFGRSTNENTPVFVPAGSNCHVSTVHGPATSPCPLGIQKRCG